MVTTVNTRAFDEISSTLQELESLTSKPGNLSSKESQRHSFLLAKLSMLRSGVSVSDLRKYEQEKLLAESGLPKMPERAVSRMDQATEQEWRNFALGREVRSSYIPKDGEESRALEAGTQSISYTQLLAGGSFVPNGIYGRLYETQKQYDQIFDEAYCNLVETADGANTAFPIWDDVATQSSQIGETVQSAEADVLNFGNTQLGAYTFRSGIVGVSMELLQDSNWPLGTVLERVFAFCHARGCGQALVSGSGVNSPVGLITGALAAGAAITVASGSSTNDGSGATGTNSIGTNDLNKCYFNLNKAYRAGANWAMNDVTLLALSEQLDKNGRPLISYRKNLTDTDSDCPYLLGKPVACCPSMPSIGSGNNAVIFYNPLYFVQRRVPSSAYVQRFAQSAAMITFGLLGFQSYLRFSSAFVSANPAFVGASIIQSHS